MAELDQIVQIQLQRQSTAVATASFQIAAILAPFTNFMERSRVYTDIDAISDEFSSDSDVYRIASKLFGQNGVGATPQAVVVGRRQIEQVQIIPNVSNNTVYTLTLNGVAYTYTSDSSATALEITAGLDAAIGIVPGIDATAASGVLTIGVTTPGTAWSVTTSANMVIDNEVISETWTASLEKLIDSDDSWYALVIPSHDAAIVEQISDAVNARRKIFGTSTQDIAVTQSGSTTDIAAKLSAKSAGRTLGIYLPTADTDYPEAAWIGAQLSYTPGSNDWDFKQLNGVTVSKISDNVRAVLRTKDTNMYTTIAGVNVMQDGNMFDGKPIDEQVLIDWLYARLQEQVYFRLINTLKVPMTNAGLAIIENEIRSVLSQAEANGGIDRGWQVTTPDVLDIPANLRAQRIAGVFKFTARLAGSIRVTQIEGVLTV